MHSFSPLWFNTKYLTFCMFLNYFYHTTLYYLFFPDISTVAVLTHVLDQLQFQFSGLGFTILLLWLHWNVNMFLTSIYIMDVVNYFRLRHVFFTHFIFWCDTHLIIIIRLCSQIFGGDLSITVVSLFVWNWLWHLLEIYNEYMEYVYIILFCSMVQTVLSIIMFLANLDAVTTQDLSKEKNNLNKLFLQQ